ncbi:MAG: DUF547 domain-containing protein [Bacteroidota bacterium]|nr:DUF547 domain-containing protein [Bacteroidota bacterium]
MKVVFLATILSLHMNAYAKGDAGNLNLIETSQKLLLQAKTHEPTDSLVKVVEAISQKDLTAQLINDTYKKAFWINLYNAFTQVILSKNPDKYKNRGAFFGDKQIGIAGRTLSLDDIEHGILRHSKVKWSLGHLTKLFPSSFEKKQRVDTVDYRIHFSLNCGAKSCPPIAFYSPDQLNKQLNTATKVYLQGEAEYNEKENIVALPAIMGWFRGDFGGKKKMINLLHQLEIVPKDKTPHITFKTYNWNLFLENYKSE